MVTAYDVIVVGARCAGSPTAMLLARRGYRVLLTDRATFPSDTLSTHVVQPCGVAALARWGLLDRVVASGCPPIDTYTFDFGPLTIAGAPGSADSPFAYCPRRTILDKMLLDAAAEAGAEIREGFEIEEVLQEGGRVVGVKGRRKDGPEIVERAAVVVGADGRNSFVARSVGAPIYNEKPPILMGYYTYWSGVPMDGRFEVYIRPGRGFAAAPTHDGQTMVVGGWPTAEMEANREDLEGNYMGLFDLAPAFAERLRRGKRESRIAGATVPNYFRRPYGPGWALVGDAGYNRDFITAQGISDAFLDAESCAAALDDALSGRLAFDETLARHQEARDLRVLPMFEMTCQQATLEPPPVEMQHLLGAIHGNQAAMDGFAQMNAGTISPATFMAPDNIAAMLGGGRA